MALLCALWASPAVAHPLQALDEVDLAQVHGAGLDLSALPGLAALAGKQTPQPGTDRDANAAATRRAEAMAPALAAALELQGRMAPRLATSAALGVTGLMGAALATQGPTFTAPIPLLTLNLPLVGMLPALPPKREQ